MCAWHASQPILCTRMGTEHVAVQKHVGFQAFLVWFIGISHDIVLVVDESVLFIHLKKRNQQTAWKIPRTKPGVVHTASGDPTSSETFQTSWMSGSARTQSCLSSWDGPDWQVWLFQTDQHCHKRSLASCTISAKVSQSFLSNTSGSGFLVALHNQDWPLQPDKTSESANAFLIWAISVLPPQPKACAKSLPVKVEVLRTCSTCSLQRAQKIVVPCSSPFPYMSGLFPVAPSLSGGSSLCGSRASELPRPPTSQCHHLCGSRVTPMQCHATRHGSKSPSLRLWKLEPSCS